ncbi:MAG: dienelactone hydrolase family protein [Cellvibrionaceae bacterium]
MNKELIEYTIEGNIFEGCLVSHDNKTPRPTVLISHAWSGLSDFEKQKAEEIAALGYNAFAIDMYGKGIRGTSLEENQKLMSSLTEDRALLRHRIKAGLAAAQSLDAVDENKIAAIGYCFGGLCVLDLARSGVPIKGVASFHGFFNPPENLPNELIKAKVIAFHGYDDPMVPPEEINKLAKEMNDAGVDWQIHTYGLTYHAFTNPAAQDPAAGTVFSKSANQRAWQTLENFFEEIF